MPLIHETPDVSSYLVYNAPVNEKTKEIRKMFDVDEETGYPRHYNWRPMARLGPNYKPEDPLLKLGEYDPKEYYSTKITMAGLCAISSIGGHYIISRYMARPFWTRSYQILLYFGAMVGGLFWALDKTLERQGTKNSITIDYVRKHPERFGEIHRPKVREVLLPFWAIR